MSTTTPAAATPPRRERPSSKYAFVTVGASASFKPLIEEVISDAFVAKLESLSYTHLVVQCGPDYDFFRAAVAANPRLRRAVDDDDDYEEEEEEDGRLSVTCFAYKDDLLADMKLATPYDGPEAVRSPGLIITHAGMYTKHVYDLGLKVRLQPQSI